METVKCLTAVFQFWEDAYDVSYHERLSVLEGASANINSSIIGCKRNLCTQIVFVQMIKGLYYKKTTGMIKKINLVMKKNID